MAEAILILCDCLLESTAMMIQQYNYEREHLFD